ncbi:trans-sialidase [Trypanosoma rangeli]|uniref:Trans-sialidase n=1 Tax=Trypanosoma rangeli TaxID=5698 RepID=A0A422NAS4_TRYRA|nr:trans-sialidase [Trypanosoma rangeli]RNF02542.1 trans-sialidase [Trypanosoma rangeli]|eukprot:RNF02542.1 trans-sialidase [Trypanosoma rangeli]
MSRYLFFSAVLLLPVVLLMCCGSGEAEAADKSLRSKLFEGGITEIPDVKDPGGAKKKFDSFSSPVLLDVHGVIVAFAEAHYKGTDGTSFTALATRSKKSAENLWTDGKAMVRDAFDSKVARLVYPTPITDNEGASILLGGYGDWGIPLTKSAGCYHWKPRYGWGDFSKEKDEREFDLHNDLSDVSRDGVHKIYGTSYMQYNGGGSPGIKMTNGNYVLPVQALSEDEKNVSLVLYSTNTWYGLTFSAGRSHAGCTRPAVLEWEGGKLLVMASCADGYRRVYDVHFKEKTWAEAVDTLSGVWGNSLNRKGYGVQGGFITATIGGKKVILLSQLVYPKEKEQKGQLHLWLTDMKRIYDVGPISTEGENAGASTLLHTANSDKKEEKLYCAYETSSDGAGKQDVVLVDLGVQLAEAKKVLEVWDANDMYVLGRQGCAKIVWAEPGTATQKPVPLRYVPAGFLSNNTNETVWKDEYLGVNAIVEGNLTATKDGVRFYGAGAQARWPVIEQGQNQHYHFTKYGLTLVATVTIHAKPSSSISLMGMRVNDDKKPILFGLSYTNNNKWEVTTKKETKITPLKTWELGKPYQVALTLQSNDWRVYVDGEEVQRGNFEEYLYYPLRHSISHFYFGDEGREATTGGHMTVGNVFLFNRLLDAGALKSLKENTATALQKDPKAKPSSSPCNTPI